ncbi:NADH-quinone oxidoreductase subunit NuoF [Estrella lausannensis]|uniref:NADH-quinone oxidoreductase subunit F n=1 Tax=Estrella lausannensis TaxID=483423 RepID=A0A0H5DQV7_9BACT|nr:NADH-quinone oxidoreductase subunit NuoF [Estrella lausannensis]CRX38947.1 NADH-quinone oxidoreductase subunit F [Estrella lausannensis]
MNEMRILTAHVHDKKQKEIDTYISHGGYEAVKKVIPHTNPVEITELVKKAELKGRGGAGFLTGTKWGFIPKDPNIDKYLVCNCDESEPGVFKDRLLIENDPHQLIEGMILASYAIGAKKSFIYTRGEYFEGIATLEKAVSEAEKRGFLGKNILGSSYSLEIIVHPGAGAYIAGEETALLNSLEGFRATPRLKPPFPAIEGLYRKPTVVNNVETLCNVVHIINRGADWFLSIGTKGSRGTKIYQASGHVKHPGCFEFPMGVTLAEVLEAAGGMLPGRKFKACYPGGSSCALLTADDLDLPLNFEDLAAKGTMLGTASLIVMDDSADMVQVAERLMEFYQNESCGKCTPCREGTRWMVQVLKRINAGHGVMADLKTIQEVSTLMAANSFCPLAAGAAPPVVSALLSFREEFEAKIQRNPDMNKLQVMKIAYPYQAGE